MILHLDIDCFYCSAERTRDASLRGIPIGVANMGNLSIFGIPFDASKVPDNGVIVTSSYEARARGVKTGMVIKEAKRFCPELKIIPGDHLLYQELSHKLHTLLNEYTPQIEKFSIDEFFCDLSGLALEKDPLSFAKMLKKRVDDELGLPISIGISSAKWIAKLATSEAKPYGIRYVPTEDILAFIEKKPIASFPGIGRVMQEKLQSHFITTLGQAARSKHLFDGWKGAGQKLYLRIIGEDNEGLEMTPKRKSIAVSRTFEPVTNREELRRRIVILSRHLCFSVLKQQFLVTTYCLKVRYEFKEKKEHRITLPRVFNEKMLREVMLDIFEKVDIYPRSAIVFLSLGVESNTTKAHRSISLIDYEQDQHFERLSDTLHSLRNKYGVDAIKNANEM